jgi:predicted MFS family arabinose efflux permease
MGGLPETLGVLRGREFRLLFGAQTVSVLGDRMVTVALAFAVLEIGGSASDVGLVLACRALPMVGSLLVGGVVADRTSPRAVMVGADLARVFSQGVLAALLVAGAADVWAVALLSGVTGAATGFFNPASTGLLPAVVAPEQLQQANGLRATAMSAGEIAGPLGAGVLVAVAGAGWALAVDAATYGASAALLAGLRLPERVERAATSFVADLRDGWKAFASWTWLWGFVAAAAFVNLLWGAWRVLGPVVAERDLGGAAAWGTVLAAMGGGALLGSLLAIRAKPRRPLVVATLTVGVFVAPLVLLAAGAPVPLLALGSLLFGAALMLGNSIWESTLQRHVPAESLSRVSAYDWFGSLAFEPVGLAIWGPISVAIGISASLWLAAALMVATTFAMLAVPDIRRLRAAPEPPIEPSVAPAPSAAR